MKIEWRKIFLDGGVEYDDGKPWVDNESRSYTAEVDVGNCVFAVRVNKKLCSGIELVERKVSHGFSSNSESMGCRVIFSLRDEARPKIICTSMLFSNHRSIWLDNGESLTISYMSRPVSKSPAVKHVIADLFPSGDVRFS